MMHNKVLLIYEDYSELNSVQSTLKKVGFDCVGISSEFSTSEQVLSFNPDIVIANGKGPKVSTTGVGRRLKDMHRWNGKTILIFPPGIKPKPQDLIKIRMDVVLEAPVQLVRLIQVLANLTNQDDQVLIEKLVKQTAVKEDQQKKEDSFSLNKKASEDNIYISGSSGKKEDERDGNKKSRKDRRGKFGQLSGSNDSDDSEAYWARGGQDDDKKKSSGFVTRESDRSTPSSKARFDLNPQTSPKGPLEKPDNPESKSGQEKNVENERVDWSQVENELLNPNAPKEKAEKENEIFFATGGEPEADDSADQIVAESELQAAIEQAEREAQSAMETEADTDTVAAADTVGDTETGTGTGTEAETETETEVEAATEIAPEQLEEMGLSGLDAPVEESGSTQSQDEDIAFVSGDISQPEDPEVQARQNELVAAQGQLADKLKRYEKMTETLNLAPESTLKRTAVKKAQKELKKDWDNDELHSQDDLRREFTKALFRKN
jgi:hypothetical protein